MPRILLSVLTTILLFSSCANYKINYSKNAETATVQLPPAEDLEYTLYLTGNGGQLVNDEASPVLKYFKTLLADAPENSAALLLGNNIYPAGMPKKDDPDRDRAERILEAQLAALHSDNFAGVPIILAGNDDWAQPDPVKGIKRQEKYVEKYLDADEQVFFPEAGCGDPTTVELTDNLVVITVDSRWFMEDWNKLEDFNDGCDITTRTAFGDYVKDEITDHKGKNIIIAIHHPPYSNGEHGGQFTLASHLFPLRSLHKNLWVPLPVVGSIVNGIRASTGKQPDVTSPMYADVTQGLVHKAEEYDSVIFVSAYEKNMQYLDIEHHKYIVSGSATGLSPVKAGDGAKFAAAVPGYSVLKVYKDGSVFTEFYRVNAEGTNATLLYRTRSKNPFPENNENYEPDMEDAEKTVFADSVSTSVYPAGYDLRLPGLFFGNFNRDLYYTDVKAPVLDLNTHLGGMKILRSGGSTQTVSLRLQDAKGRVYNLRSLRKNPISALPDNVNFPLSQRFMRRFFTGINPFGAFVVPTLSEATDIKHSKPQLFYLPEQDALGKYNKRYSKQLYMLEERPDETWLDEDLFGEAQDFISYRKLFEEVRTEDDKLVKIDQPVALRIRLLDIMIGDFDRHLDQYRMAEEETEDAFVYRPIPRDRDVAFSNWNGAFFYLGKVLDPLIRMNHDYDKRITDLKWLIYQARGFDDNFLNELTWEDWQREVKTMQDGLTDEVIDTALRQMPAPIYAQKGKQMEKALKARRDDLPRYARKFYEIVNENVLVVGTDDNDVFEITRLPDGKTRVQAWTANKHGEKRKQFFDRTYTPDVTKEIRVFGLDNEDFFTVTGEAKKGIKVRLVGGYEEDTFTDESKVSGLRKMTLIHDDKGDNIVNKGKETRDLRTDLYEPNTYTYLKGDRNFNYIIPFVIGGYNPDNGVIVGLTADYFTFPYRRKNKQRLAVTYALDTKSINFEYTGEFQSIFNGRLDLNLHAQNFGPQFVRNYFGYGNETELPTGENRDRRFNFNRISLSRVTFAPSLMRRFTGSNFFSFGAFAETVEVDKTEGRILDSPVSDVDPQVFRRNYFGGVRTAVRFNFINDNLNPENSFRFTSELSWRANLEDYAMNYANIDAAFTYVTGWGEPRRITLASKLGYARNFGDFFFYQGVNLGGNTNLRGFRADRFTGEEMVFQNTDLRFRLLTSRNKVIPFSAGVYTGFDYGRVWIEERESDVWHYSYGGGLWLAPLDGIVINAAYFTSVEDTRFAVQLGFAF